MKKYLTRPLYSTFAVIAIILVGCDVSVTHTNSKEDLAENKRFAKVFYEAIEQQSFDSAASCFDKNFNPATLKLSMEKTYSRFGKLLNEAYLNGSSEIESSNDLKNGTSELNFLCKYEKGELIETIELTVKNNEVKITRYHVKEANSNK
jgi:hypothetical protein